MKRFFQAFLMANHPHGKPAVHQKKNQKTPHTPTDAASHISVTHRDDTDVFTSFQQPFIFDDAPLWPPRPSLLQLGVCVCVCSAFNICVYPQSQSMSLSTVPRFECRAGHQSRF